MNAQQSRNFTLEAKHNLQTQSDVDINIAEQQSFQLHLRHSVDRVQKAFISERPYDEALELLLNELLALTGSAFGLIGDVLLNNTDTPYLKVRVLTNIAWSEETKALFEENKKNGLEFHRTDNLLGEVMRTGKPVIANSPSSDKRSGGTPVGHPKLNTYIGIPFFNKGKVIGMVGLANREGGFNDALIASLNPLIDSLEVLTEARILREELQHSQTENAHLAAVVKETINGVLLTDTEFKIQWCNASFESVSTYSIHDLKGESPLDFFARFDDSVRTINSIRQAIKTKASIEFEAKKNRKVGKPYWARVSCSPTYSAKGEHIGFVYMSLDITQSRIQQDELASFKSVVDQTSDAVLFYDALSLNIIYANQGAQRQLQRSEAELLQLKPYDLKPEYDRESFQTLITPLLNGSMEKLSLKTVHQSPQGTLLPVEVSMQLVLTSSGQMLISNILRDISLQTRLDELRVDQQNHVLNLLQRSADAIGIIEDGRLVDANKAALDLFGFHDRALFIGQTLTQISTTHQLNGDSEAVVSDFLFAALTEGYQRFEWLYKTVRCDKTPIEVTLTPVIYHNKVCVQTVWRDLTDTKAKELEIRKLAYFDEFTGLANKNMFNQRLSDLLSLAKRFHYSIATAFVQIINISDIKETLGYSAGDLVLKAVAERLATNVRGIDTFARYFIEKNSEFELENITIDREFDSLASFNTDSFALAAVVSDNEVVAPMMERLIRTMADPINVLGSDIVASMRYGIAIFPEDAGSSEALRRAASIALKQSIQQNTQVCYFTAALGEQIQRNALVMRSLELTLVKNPQDISLRFQPQVELCSNELIGAEVLIRWQDPLLGWVSPSAFIPLAEERGLIDKVTSLVVEMASRQVCEWRQMPENSGSRRNLKLAINLSARNLDNVVFLESLLEQIKTWGLSNKDFEFELTETGLMRDPESAIGLLQNLKESGFQIAIDDFGTGHSSLNYLRNINADILKIDMSFVKNMMNDTSNYAIVKTVIATANIFGMKTLAEGVEDETTAKELHALGCDYAQGYYYDAPLLGKTFYEKWINICA